MEIVELRLPEQHMVRIGPERYRIDRLLGPGRHSVAYHALQLGPDDEPIATAEYVIKHPAFSLSAFEDLRHLQLSIADAVQSQLDYIGNLYDVEAAIIATLDPADPRYVGIFELDGLPGSEFLVTQPSGASVTDKVSEIDEFREAVAAFPTIPLAILPYVSLPSLKSWISGLHALGKILEPDQIVGILRSLVKAIDDLHAHLIVHNDLSASNVLVREDSKGLQVVLIDFDQAYSLMESTRIEEPRRFLRSYSRPERSAVNFDSDIYQIGTLALYLMTGVEGFTFEDLKQRRDDSDGDAIWSSIVDCYLNQSPQDQSHPALAWIRALVIKCTTPHYREKYHSIHDLRITINQIRRQIQPRRDFESFKEEFVKSDEVMGRERLIEEMLEQDDSELLARLTFARQVRGDYELMRSRSRLMSVNGDREEIVNFYLELMGSLAPGSKYKSYSSGSFWADHNLGVNGRFLVACRLFVERGGYLTTLFTVPAAVDREFRSVGNSKDSLAHLSVEARRVLSVLRAQNHAIEMLKYPICNNFAVKILVTNDETPELVDSESLAAFISSKVSGEERFVDFTLRNLIARRRSVTHRLTPLPGEPDGMIEEFIFGVILRRDPKTGPDSAYLDRIFHQEEEVFSPISLHDYLALIEEWMTDSSGDVPRSARTE